jgi:hypothetical protein
MSATLNIDQTAARIAAAWRQAPEHWEAGASWYPSARAEAAAMSPGDIARGAGVIAALSPRAHWNVYRRWAREILAAADAGASEPPAVGIGLFRDRAWRIAQGAEPLDVLQGPKVRAFYRAILGEPIPVVDVWAARVAGWNGQIKPPTYEALTAAYERAAGILGVNPSTLQAATWIAARGKAD